MTFHRIVFVTGLSGAGKSQAMKAFEDLGFYCVDNLPPVLAARTLALLDAGQHTKVALALDVRSGGPLGEAGTVFDALTTNGTQHDILFLEARDDVLVRRYSETRRRHPFSSGGTLTEAIAVERTTMAALRERAATVVDTSSLTQLQLKDKISTLYAPPQDARRLGVVFVAFGFKYGIPLDLDLLFDARFLRNPYYVDELRLLTGADEPVGHFIEADIHYGPFVSKITDFLEFVFPLYYAEGKAQLTVGLGCTGGRHRSVYLARELFRRFESNALLNVHLQTRDTTR